MQVIWERSRHYRSDCDNDHVNIVAIYLVLLLHQVQHQETGGQGEKQGEKERTDYGRDGE